MNRDLRTMNREELREVIRGAEPVRRPVPMLLLDLDGVLSPFAAASCPDGHQERILFEGEEPVRFCPAHGDWIRELAAVGDVWWATGWGVDANTHYLPLLGVEPLPVVRFPPVPFEPELKVPAIDAVVGDRPAAWIDDNHTSAGRRWAAARSAPTLLIPIDPSTGWTRPDVDRVLDWARSDYGGRVSTGHASAPIGDLPPIGRPANSALLEAGVTTLAQVAAYRRRDLLGLHGVGPKAVNILAAALAERGLTFAD